MVNKFWNLDQMEVIEDQPSDLICYMPSLPGDLA